MRDMGIIRLKYTIILRLIHMWTYIIFYVHFVQIYLHIDVVQLHEKYRVYYKSFQFLIELSDNFFQGDKIILNLLKN